jgi:hypothetical protein
VSQPRNHHEMCPNYEVGVREILAFRHQKSGQEKVGSCTELITE